MRSIRLANCPRLILARWLRRLRRRTEAGEGYIRTSVLTREGEGVSREGDLGAACPPDDDLYDVYAYGNARGSQQAQPGFRAPRDGLLLGGIHGICRTTEAAWSASLYLDENQGLLFPAYEIDLSAMCRAKVSVEDFEALAA